MVASAEASGAAIDPTCVTASQLVRNFGVWQDRALGDPVYILHRGRPRLALASIDFLERLTRSALQASDPDAPLIEAFDMPVLVFDAHGEMVASNRAAIGYFGLDRPRARFGASQCGPVEAIIVQMAARVARQRIGERSDARPPGSDIRVEISAYPAGDRVVVVVADISARSAARSQAARIAATEAAIGAQTGVASARLNLRGYIDGAAPSLECMAGVSAAQLATTRFASLFDVRTRVGVTDAIERILRGGAPERIAATLLVAGSDRRAVSLSLAGIDDQGDKRGAVALLSSDDTATLPEG